jgi:hypothetical protein
MNKRFIIAACLVLLGGAAPSASASELSKLCAAKAGVTPVKLNDAKIKEILSERGFTQGFEVYLHPHTGEIVRVR